MNLSFGVRSCTSTCVRSRFGTYKTVIGTYKTVKMAHIRQSRPDSGCGTYETVNMALSPSPTTRRAPIGRGNLLLSAALLLLLPSEEARNEAGICLDLTNFECMRHVSAQLRTSASSASDRLPAPAFVQFSIRE